MRKTLLTFSVLTLVVTFCTRQAHNIKPESVTFTIQRHGVQLTPQDAQAVIAKGIAILSKSSVPTQVSINFDGNVTDGGGTGIINDCDAMNALLGTKGVSLHVVKEIHCCGGVQGGDIVGCSGPNLPIVARPINISTEMSILKLRAVQWMHEFGHNRRLCHRRGEGAPLMYDTPSSGNTDVDQCEHDAFLNPASTGTCVSCSGPQPSRLSAPDFIRQNFIEGIPYEQGSSYTAADVPGLIDMLSQDCEQINCGNIVTVLGMIGDSRAFIPLKSFLERDTGLISLDVYSAKINVPIALGYLLARTNDPNVMLYLKEGRDPSAWSAKIKWHSASFQDDAARNAHLTTMTILGLGLSGRVEGRTDLQNLLTDLQLDAKSVHDSNQPGLGKNANDTKILPAKFEDRIIQVLTEAVEINKRVEVGGLINYYRESRKKQLGFNP